MKFVPNLLDDTYIKPIDDSKMFYITNDGNVWSTNTNKWLTKHINKYGYEQITLRYGNNDMRTYRINRLVSLAFVENPNNYPSVCHKDENKLNNNYYNLEWGTQKYNNNYGNHNKNLSISKKKKIWMCDKITHKKIKLFNSSKEAIEYLNSIKICKNNKICSSNINGVISGKQKSAYGYWWEREGSNE